MGDAFEADGSIDTLPLIGADPAATWVVRLSAAFGLAPLLAGILAIDWFIIRTSTDWWGLASVLAVMVWVMLAIVLPGRWVASLGHAVDGDELRVVRGNIRRVDTVVPLSRVQHIDVDQGPLQRRAGLATVVIHTAGTSATLVPVAHLPHDDAVALRDRIRARIALRG